MTRFRRRGFTLIELLVVIAIIAVLLDGSVRFTKSTISQAAWRALGTRSGGEVISADNF